MNIRDTTLRKHLLSILDVFEDTGVADAVVDIDDACNVLDMANSIYTSTFKTVACELKKSSK